MYGDDVVKSKKQLKDEKKIREWIAFLEKRNREDEEEIQRIRDRIKGSNDEIMAKKAWLAEQEEK